MLYDPLRLAPLAFSCWSPRLIVLKCVRQQGGMKPSHRQFRTVEALGIASIIETATGSSYNVEQDLKGRWHVWAAPPTQADTSDHIARHLEPDLFCPEV